VLVALCEGLRIEAEHAERGRRFICPQCARAVILKRGRKVVAHFAHKPPVNCIWAKGETRAHLEAKRLIKDTLIARGLRAEVEYIVPALPNDRRADVMTWRPRDDGRVAIELQHTTISLDNIEERAFAYAREGIAQAWIPFFRQELWDEAEPLIGGPDGDFFIERYPARPFERWIHGFNMGEIWFYDSNDKVLWCGVFDGHEIYVEPSSWYEAGGEEAHAGGYYRWSRRWRELTLRGPVTPDRIRIAIKRRTAWKRAAYNWPSGYIAQFLVTSE
jgi:hypothetical protein